MGFLIEAIDCAAGIRPFKASAFTLIILKNQELRIIF